MSQIDSTGTFIFDVVESGLGVSKKSSFPQWIARLKAVKKYISEQSEMAHFKLTEPAYVDWSSFDEDIIAYMVLFKSADKFDDESKLLNYEQLKIATGWDGTEFDSVTDGTFIGKKILGRVEENTYEDKTSLQVSWIDAEDAPPERQLKVLDVTEVKALTAKLSFTKKTAPAKPTAAPANPAPAATKPGATKPAASKPAETTKPAETPKPAEKAAPKPPKKAATPPPPAEDAAEETTGLPGEITQADAWSYVIAHKGTNEDSVIEEAWLSACQEVGGNKDEDSFTTADWAKVRDVVVKDCSLAK